MTKSEKRLLIFVTTAVCILLAVAIAASAFVVFNYINRKHIKGYSEDNSRDIFEECAYIAQAHINCCEDAASSEIRIISDYTVVWDWYANPIGYCFYFKPTGYALITSYDYAVQKSDAGAKSPFYSFDETMDDSQLEYIYSLCPTTAVLSEKKAESVRKFRTFESGSCFIRGQESPNNLIYAKDGSTFEQYDVIYPGVLSSYPDDREFFTDMIQPNDSFRERMIKTADKQLEEYGCSKEDAAELISAFVKASGNYPDIK